MNRVPVLESKDLNEALSIDRTRKKTGRVDLLKGNSRDFPFSRCFSFLLVSICMEYLFLSPHRQSLCVLIFIASLL